MSDGAAAASRGRRLRPLGSSFSRCSWPASASGRSGRATSRGSASRSTWPRSPRSSRQRRRSGWSPRGRARAKREPDRRARRGAPRDGRPPLERRSAAALRTGRPLEAGRHALARKPCADRDRGNPRGAGERLDAALDGAALPASRRGASSSPPPSSRSSRAESRPGMPPSTGSPSASTPTRGTGGDLAPVPARRGRPPPFGAGWYHISNVYFDFSRSPSGSPGELRRGADVRPRSSGSSASSR